MLELSQRGRPVEPGTRVLIFDRIARPAGRLVNRLLAPTGLKVVQNTPPPPPCDLRKVTDDPLEGAYRARDRAFVIDVPLRDCRAFGVTAFALTAEAGHPYVETILAYSRGDCHGHADSPLWGGGDGWKPANAAEALGLAPAEAHPALRTGHPLAAVLPWEANDPDTAMALNINIIRAEYRAHGGPDLAPEYGGGWSESDAEFDFDRLMRVYKSIRTRGYRRSDHVEGDISALILSAQGMSRIHLRGGQHRIAVLAALGYQHAPIRLSPFIIRRDDVGSWPNVRSGLFTREQALAVFDRIFDGRQPAGCNWAMIWTRRQERCR